MKSMLLYPTLHSIFTENVGKKQLSEQLLKPKEDKYIDTQISHNRTKEKQFISHKIE